MYQVNKEIKQQYFESLSNIMMVYSKNPQTIQDPVLSQIFMKIIEVSGVGISPISLMAAIQEQAEADCSSTTQPDQPQTPQHLECQEVPQNPAQVTANTPQYATA